MTKLIFCHMVFESIHSLARGYALSRTENMHEEKVRQKIMDATRECIQEKGVDKTRMGDVAKSLGLARQTLYNYFPSREALFEDVFTREAINLANDAMEHLRDYRGLENKLIQAFMYPVEQLPANSLLKHLLSSGNGYIQSIGISRETMQYFGELVLVEVFEQSHQLKRESAEIAEVMSRNIMAFLLLPDKSPRTSSELERYVRRRILPSLMI